MSHRGRATLKEVAALAQVSIGTASRALNDSGYVSKEARARVVSASSELNYQPDLRARGLRKRSSWCVGLIIPDLLNAYYTALADTVSQLLARQGYHLILSSTRDDPANEQATLFDMVGQNADGLIWVPTSPDEQLLSFLGDQGTPAVAIVRRVPGDKLDTVVFEDLAGSKAATSHLIGLGHSRIAYIGGDIAFSSNRDRWQGYLQAHSEAGLPVDESLVKLGTTSGTWGRLATPDILHLSPQPTALYVASNGLMPGVMRALRQHDVAIPQEMSLLCFDDVDWFSYSVPPITAVKVGHEYLAEMAVDLLMRRIRKPPEPEGRPAFLTASYELVLRDSTAPPRPDAVVAVRAADFEALSHA